MVAHSLLLASEVSSLFLVVFFFVFALHLLIQDQVYLSIDMDTYMGSPLRTYKSQRCFISCTILFIRSSGFSSFFFIVSRQEKWECHFFFVSSLKLIRGMPEGRGSAPYFARETTMDEKRKEDWQLELACDDIQRRSYPAPKHFVDLKKGRRN